MTNHQMTYQSVLQIQRGATAFRRRMVQLLSATTLTPSSWYSCHRNPPTHPILPQYTHVQLTFIAISQPDIHEFRDSVTLRLNAIQRIMHSREGVVRIFVRGASFTVA